MKKPVIVISQQLPEIVEARFMRDYDARLNPSIKLYDKEKLLQLCKGADGIAVSIGDKIDADFIERLPESVRIISAFSAGFEHIDIKAASMRKIAVTNTPEILTNATADIAMLLLLGAARRAVEGDKMVRSGE
ncbi:MAG: D-glycerate dehydrogenase, partial [Alphaproteobacteria bacterium]|nr:D-glycerate dehydrogenase [Alphaproteobacteria bacterium]